MESIDNLINLLKPNVYIASIDLKDACNKPFQTKCLHNSNRFERCFLFSKNIKIPNILF